MLKIYFILLLMAGICFMNGCAAGPYRSIPYDVKQDKERNLKVVILDKELDNQFSSKRVVILSQKTDLTEDGRLKVYCEIRNMKKELLRLQVQTIFRDEKGVQIGDDTNWELILIPQYSTHAYKMTAYSTKAKDYTIRIRSAQ